MKASQNLKNLIASPGWEGLKQQVYLDSGGAPTIGIGHRLTRYELSSGKIEGANETIRYQNGITVKQCWDILDNDLKDPEENVNRGVRVTLTQNQFDALVSFCFNVGGPAFLKSTLLNKLNSMLFQQVPEQLRRWIHDNGKVVQGLINRREKEIALWKTPITEVPHA
jgi:lysozyme